MGNNSYSRKQLEGYGEGFPDKGLHCAKCKTFVPQFDELSDEDSNKIIDLHRDDDFLIAMEKLQIVTGCSKRFAKIWIIHKGAPKSFACPYCSKPIRSKFAKQCRQCKRDWHDKNNLKWLS